MEAAEVEWLGHYSTTMKSALTILSPIKDGPKNILEYRTPDASVDPSSRGSRKCHCYFW